MICSERTEVITFAPDNLYDDKYDDDRMPDEITELYYPLWAEVCFLRMAWQDYRILFSPENLAFGNTVAPAFWVLLQSMILDYVVITLCRLTDTTRSGRHSNPKENLTLTALVEAIPAGSADEEEMRARAAHLADTARTQAAFLREHRNRRIAHNDRATLLDEHPEPLYAIEDQEINRTIQAVTAVLTITNGFYQGGENSFPDPLTNGDGGTIMTLLRLGLEKRMAETTTS